MLYVPLVFHICPQSSVFLIFSTGSKEEREVYEKAGRRATEPTNEITEPGQLQLSIKHPNPVFGTDFDVIIEVWRVQMAAEQMNGWLE